MYSARGDLNIAVSSDGRLIAYNPDYQKVTIITNEGLFVTNFTPYTNSISSLAFTSNNTLMVISSDGNLCILSPTGCLPTFLNNDGRCFCSSNATLVNKMCQYRANFMPDIKNSSCSCP
jgi:hypothetical protein